MTAILTIFITLSLFFMFGISILTYGYWWKPASLIQKNESISKIEFKINERNNEELVTATVYLLSNSSRKRLSSQDTLSINGNIMNAVYYNNGIASGYKYLLNLQKSKEYILSLKREGKDEVIKTIVPHVFSINIPLTISKKNGISLQYTTDIPINIKNIFIELSSLDGEIGFTATEEHKEGNITIDPESIKSLKNIKTPLNISMRFDQADGDYIVGNVGEVEILD